MIKYEDLREFRPVYRYNEGTDISLQAIRTAIDATAKKYGIPVAFEMDQIKSGGFLNKSVEDCLVLYHPEHAKDYYRIAISIQRQGTMAFVHVNDFGESKNLKKLESRGQSKEAFKNAMKSDAGSYSVGSDSYGAQLLKSGFKALASLGGSKAKQEEENNYYDALITIIDEVIC